MADQLIVAALGFVVMLVIAFGITTRQTRPHHQNPMPIHRQDPYGGYYDPNVNYGRNTGNGCLTFLAIIGVITILAVGFIILWSIAV